MTEPGFFDVDERLAALSAAGGPLERLGAAVLMFKVLVLQALYSLSDDAAEFQIRDRLVYALSWAEPR